jgi:hypothetical protein
MPYGGGGALQQGYPQSQTSHEETKEAPSTVASKADSLKLSTPKQETHPEKSIVAKKPKKTSVQTLGFSPAGVGIGAVLGSVAGGFGVKFSQWGTNLSETKTEKQPPPTTESKASATPAEKSKPVKTPPLQTPPPVKGEPLAIENAPFSLNEGYEWRDPANYLAITNATSGITYDLSDDTKIILKASAPMEGGELDWRHSYEGKDIKCLRVPIDKDHALAKLLQENLSGNVIKNGVEKVFEPTPEGWFIQYEREMVQDVHKEDIKIKVGKNYVPIQRGDLLFTKGTSGLLDVPVMLCKKRAFLCNQAGEGFKLLEFELPKGQKELDYLYSISRSYSPTRTLVLADMLFFKQLGKFTEEDELNTLKKELNAICQGTQTSHTKRFEALETVVIAKRHELTSGSKVVSLPQTVEEEAALILNTFNLPENVAELPKPATPKTATTLAKATETTVSKSITKLNIPYIVGGAIGLGLLGGLLGYFLTKEIKDETAV